MTTPRPLVRHRALRVALTATLAVALMLVALLAVTDLIVARNLTAGIDDHLRERLERPIPPGEDPQDVQAADRDFDEPLVQWVISPAGAVTAGPATPVLPASLYGTAGPVTATLSGGTFRVAGVRLVNGSHLILAASLAPTEHAVGTLLVTEALAVPVLLLLVFGGALLIGSRVAGPIERMRQRQLAFTADASHQLRTPLAVISAEASLARTGSEAEMGEALERVNAEAARMRRIVDDLLWLARFESEPQAGSKQPVDLATIATMTVDRFGAVAERRSLTLTAHVPAEGSLFVVTTPEWLDHLAGILVDNACRYSPVGGSVDVSVAAAGGRVELAVTDSGPGIPFDDAGELFHRYRRGTTEGEGVGLGLAIADAIVHTSGGRWDVSNREQGGARFAVSWPLATAD